MRKLFPWMEKLAAMKKAANKNSKPVISIFDPPGQCGLRFAIRRGDEVQYHRYLPGGGYSLVLSRRLRGRIGRALMKAEYHDWNTPRPFICDL